MFSTGIKVNCCTKPVTVARNTIKNVATPIFVLSSYRPEVTDNRIEGWATCDLVYSAIRGSSNSFSRYLRNRLIKTPLTNDSPERRIEIRDGFFVFKPDEGSHSVAGSSMATDMLGGCGILSPGDGRAYVPMFFGNAPLGVVSQQVHNGDTITVSNPTGSLTLSYHVSPSSSLEFSSRISFIENFNANCTFVTASAHDTWTGSSHGGYVMFRAKQSVILTRFKLTPEHSAPASF